MRKENLEDITGRKVSQQAQKNSRPRNRQLGCKAEKSSRAQKADGSDIKHKERAEITTKQQILQKVKS